MSLKLLGLQFRHLLCMVVTCYLPLTNRKGLLRMNVLISTLELCLSATGSSGIICGCISAALQIEVPSDRACVLMKFVLPTASPEAAHSRNENIICIMKEAIKNHSPR